MLVDYKFNNYTSFFDETKLSMKASSDKRFREENTFRTFAGSLNKSLFIFGPNGSGKSNLIDSFEYMCSCVLAPFEVQSKFISFDNFFIFNERSEDKPKSFEVSFIIDKILYEYGFSILSGKIDKEYLYKKNRRKTEVFRRDSPSWSDIKITSEFENVKNLIKNTREDALFLSWANFGNNELAMKIYDWFSRIKVFDGNDANDFLSSTVKYIEDNERNKKKVLEFLNKADLHMLNFNLEIKEDDAKKFLLESLKQNVASKMNIFSSLKKVDIRVLHKLFSEDWKEIGTVESDISMESSGTRKMFELAGPIIDAMENGKIIIIDEIDSRLHPLLVNHLVRLFNSNNTNAQLICTTHNILLLEEDLRKEQIYFTNKNEYGVSSLTCLSEFKRVRKESKLIKQYLLGMFDGIPKFN